MSALNLSDLRFEALVRQSEREKRQRARDMKTVKEALEVAWRGWKRLQDLGFNDACYCPKDGTPFEVVEWGSTGIFRCTYEGKWPDGLYMVEDGGDIWPTGRGGMLWRPLPAENSANSPSEASASAPATDETNPSSPQPQETRG